MNLDLNLGPSPTPELGSGGSVPGEAPSLVDDWIDEPIRRIRDAAWQRARLRRRWRHVQNPHGIPMDLNELMVSSPNGTPLLAGEGSAAAGERANELPKSCENNTGFAEHGEANKKDDDEKDGGNDGSFFDCNICLDLARDPVVTCCGHLFCWPCLYQWLHVHADVKECPVCKGEVTVKNVTPIYGRGNHVREPEDDSDHKIPPRPHARRVESLRQTIQRTAIDIPLEEMIRRLGNRFDLSRDLISPPQPESTHERVTRTSSLLDRFLQVRGMRNREQNPVLPPEDAVNLVQSGAPNHEGSSRPLHSILLRRPQSHRSALTSLSSALTTERLVEAYFRNHNLGRNQEQPTAVDDRDSFSSSAAVINSESQVDTAMEIDSLVSLSTSSSRRRNDASRVADLDSGDSRAPRRRRLN
ncbi:hypothetical protein SAY87_024123 [Trapa incisa]|uniref:E3 ubiquitin-protein ligase RMA n=1 Tax=Trapa incisa TaxID=236973 RepID=A0AAN7QRX6_9MYRT|nr:hypothetical protein SAY87_024123 [Trapa incisa]